MVALVTMCLFSFNWSPSSLGIAGDVRKMHLFASNSLQKTVPDGDKSHHTIYLAVTGFSEFYIASISPFYQHQTSLGLLVFVPPFVVVKRFNQISHVFPSEPSGIVKYFKFIYVEGNSFLF